MVLHQKPISAEILKEKFLGKDRSAPTLLQLLKYHHDINQDVLAPGTMKNYVTTEAYLRRFLKFKFKREDIFLPNWITSLLQTSSIISGITRYKNGMFAKETALPEIWSD